MSMESCAFIVIPTISEVVGNPRYDAGLMDIRSGLVSSEACQSRGIFSDPNSGLQFHGIVTLTR